MWSWALSALGSGTQGVHHVQALPRQVQIVAAKVAVGGHLLVDGALEVKAADDGRRAQVEGLIEAGPSRFTLRQ